MYPPHGNKAAAFEVPDVDGWMAPENRWTRGGGHADEHMFTRYVPDATARGWMSYEEEDTCQRGLIPQLYA